MNGYLHFDAHVKQITLSNDPLVCCRQNVDEMGSRLGRNSYYNNSEKGSLFRVARYPRRCPQLDP